MSAGSTAIDAPIGLARTSVAKADIREVTVANVWFIILLFAILMLVTYVPAVPMALVELFYR